MIFFGFGAEGLKVAKGHQPSAGAGKVTPVRARPFLVIGQRLLLTILPVSVHFCQFLNGLGPVLYIVVPVCVCVCQLLPHQEVVYHH
jgi:hypothetical protein